MPNQVNNGIYPLTFPTTTPPMTVRPGEVISYGTLLTGLTVTGNSPTTPPVDSLTRVTVTGKLQTDGGVRQVGSVLFKPVRFDAGGDVLYCGATLSAGIDSSSNISIPLPGTDDPATATPGFKYLVTEPSGASYLIDVPIASPGGTLDLGACTKLAIGQTAAVSTVGSTLTVAPPSGSAATDTANIQAALTQAHTNGGGHVQLATGTYLIQAPASASDGGVHAWENTVLSGRGIGQTILKVVNGTSAGISGIVRTVSGAVNASVQFRDFTIDGNKANMSGTPTIIGFFAGVTPQSTATDTDIVCERVEIMNCSDYGFDPHERVTRLRLFGCLSHHNGTDGFTLDGCYDFLVEQCVAYANGRHGFNFVTASQRGRVVGCDSYGNTTNGYTLQQGAKSIALSACQAQGNGGAGFVINGVAQSSPQLDTVAGGGHTLTGCSSLQSGGHGVQVVGSSGNTLTGHHCQDSSQTANNTSDHYLLDESGTNYSQVNSLVGCTWGQTAGVTNAAKYGVEEKTSTDGPNLVVGCLGFGTTNVDLMLRNATSAVIAAHNGTGGAHPPSFAYSFDNPSRHGYKEWNYPPDLAGASGGVVATAGIIYGLRVDVQQGSPISNIVLVTGGTAAAGLTSAVAVVIDGSGAEVARTGDISTQFGVTGVVVNLALQSSFTPVPGATYAVLLLFVGTTGPTLIRSSATSPTTPNAGFSSTSPRRYFTLGTGQTVITTPLTLSSTTATNAQPFWVALY